MALRRLGRGARPAPSRQVRLCGGDAAGRPALLCFNPNTSADFTQKLRQAVGGAAGGVRVDCAQPDSGPASIEGVFDEGLSMAPSLSALLRLRPGYDGVVVACFSDHPLTDAAREVLACPVVGIFESACLTATLLGHTFSIVTTNARWRPLLANGAARLGYAGRLASVRTTDLPVLALEGGGAAGVRSKICEESARAVAEDGAEVIVLGCAGMVGLKEEVSAAVGPGVPVVDPVSSGVELCAGLVRQRLRTAKRCLQA
eukprot:TRINITY_DN25285_c0_g1_i2.p1 TRINITY_DN25285_c0_g1~~TRINITY_DN25285_c0_g1_i2.p1  ORF type:complete len:280 (+),score=76.90 TRINITY_DN25285_c0_g1_i2:67-840(+)